MSQHTKHWTEEIEEYAVLPIGESTLVITGEPHMVEGDYGLRLTIPTNKGNWALSNRSPLARELKKWYGQLGKLEGTTLVIARTGEGKDSRYSLKQLIPATSTPPFNPNLAHAKDKPVETIVDISKLSPEKRREIEQLLYK